MLLLSSEPKCNTLADLIIGTVDQDLRECCQSDDEREQIGLAKAVGHSIGDCQSDRPAAVPISVSRGICATGCRAGATRRSTPPEPINCAGGVKR